MTQPVKALIVDGSATFWFLVHKLAIEIEKFQKHDPAHAKP